MTKPPRSPRTARPCPTSARRPAPILASRYPEAPAKPAHRVPTLAARPTNAAAPRPTLDRTPSATRHLPAQQPRSLPAEKSPNGTASENLGASRKPPPAFWPAQAPRATENLGASNETLLELTICRSHPDVARCPQIQVGRPNVESVQLRGRLSTPSNNEGRSRPRPLQRLVRSREDLPRGARRLAPLRTRNLRASTQPPPKSR